MKIKRFIFGLFAILNFSCSSPRYLPSSDKIDVNEYGSYIKLKRKTLSNVNGELIAIDSNKIVVLTEDTKKCLTVPVNDVVRFSLGYAKPKRYGWSIPVYTLATIGHGTFLVLTAPVNLLVTIPVTVTGNNAFKYSDRNMTYEKLKMFARFPQGTPSNIKLESIK